MYCELFPIIFLPQKPLFFGLGSFIMICPSILANIPLIEILFSELACCRKLATVEERKFGESSAKLSCPKLSPRPPKTEKFTFSLR